MDGTTLEQTNGWKRIGLEEEEEEADEGPVGNEGGRSAGTKHLACE